MICLRLFKALNQTAYSSETFVVGSQKVCINSAYTPNFFKQTFWNTNDGGKFTELILIYCIPN